MQIQSNSDILQSRYRRVKINLSIKTLSFGFFVLPLKPILGEATQPLAELPQFLGGGVVCSLRVEFPHGAVGEVTPTEVLDALLQGAVKGGLGSLDGVLEEEEGEGYQEELQH